MPTLARPAVEPDASGCVHRAFNDDVRIFLTLSAVVLVSVITVAASLSVRTAVAMMRMPAEYAQSVDAKSVGAVILPERTGAGVPQWRPSEVTRALVQREFDQARVEVITTDRVAAAGITKTVRGNGALAERADLRSVAIGVVAKSAAAGSAKARIASSDAASGRIPHHEARSCFAGPVDHAEDNYSMMVGADFGQRLARAAMRQTRQFVFYVDRYFRIDYPSGDVPFLYGVCTDVVVRAFRAVGIDLQKRVYDAGLGLRDRNIDHRRVSVLRRYFTRYGESLPASDDADAYLPGDVVTYYRPNRRGLRTHIAIVSDRVGPSGALMIVHNQGQGVQLEDALFSDPITGHFRYGGGAVPTGEIAASGRDGKQALVSMR